MVGGSGLVSASVPSSPSGEGRLSRESPSEQPYAVLNARPDHMGVKTAFVGGRRRSGSPFMADIAKEAIWFGSGPNMRHHGRERLCDRPTSKRSPARTLTVLLEWDESLGCLGKRRLRYPFCVRTGQSASFSHLGVAVTSDKALLCRKRRRPLRAIR
jgi:hypothetical protein